MLDVGKERLPSDDSSMQPPSVALKLDLASQVNFACHQNSIPLIRSLILINNAKDALTGLSVTLKAKPAFVESKTWKIEHIAGNGGEVAVTDRATFLDGEFLHGLSEKLHSDVQIEVKDAEGTILCRSALSIDVLARNEWGGYANTPHLLSAFCTPNDPAVDRILRMATKELKRFGKDSCFRSYQNATPRQVWMQASAVWNALVQLDITYAQPPASFEANGQKIRSPGQILSGKVATCLDTSLLMAATFEQMGLNPLIVIEQGHAYVGLWLRKDCFALPYNEDPEALRKRADLKELILIESTLLCWRGKFTSALRTAGDSLRENNSKFIGVVDIHRCRDARIFPLSLHRDTDFFAQGPTETDEDDTQAALELPDDNDVCSEETLEIVKEKPQTRLEHWQRQLLDLTLRNPLLKLKKRRANIDLIVPNPGKLEDLLAEGKTISIVASPEEDGRDKDLFAQTTGTDLLEEQALTALERRKVYAKLTAKELDIALTALYRETRADLEEGGANTLFLCIGMLKWRREEKKKEICYAPLILIPVSLSRKSIRSGIKMTLHDDEPRFNTTLLELLRMEFALDIKGLDDALPTDESGVDTDGILNRMRREVRDAEGFEVIERVMLGRFSFAKFLLWKDLVDCTESLKKNPVVRHLIDSPKDPYAEAKPFVEPRKLDQTIEPKELFTPLPFDSSQLSAVVAAASGNDFVLQGPPGTGKSQTIANIIAMNLALGRRVLFVSEKSAALHVVYDRLQQQGLGDFCLELHSNKAKKTEVLAQLDRAWSAGFEQAQEKWSRLSDSLKIRRDRLNQYVQALHQHHNNGMSVFEALGKVVRHPDTPIVKLNWASSDQHSMEDMEKLREVAERIDLHTKEVGDIARHPLGLVMSDDWSNAWQAELLQLAERLGVQIQMLQQQLAATEQQLKIRFPKVTLKNLATLSEFLRALLDAYGKDLGFAFSPTARQDLEALDAALKHLDSFFQAEQSLSTRYNRTAALTLDLVTAKNLHQKAESSIRLLQWFHRWRCRQFLKKSGGTSEAPSPINDLPSLRQMQAQADALKHLKANLQRIPGYIGLDSDSNGLRRLSGIAQRIRKGSGLCAEDVSELPRICQTLSALLADGNELLDTGAPLGMQLSTANEACSVFQRALMAFMEAAGANREQYAERFSGGLPALAEAINGLRREQSKLHPWCAWRRARREAVGMGLLPLVEAVEQGLVATGHTRQSLEVNYARWWAAQKIDSNEVLRKFVPVEHEKIINDFGKLVEYQQKITRDVIHARLRTQITPKHAAGKPTEGGFGLIRREIEKKRRHKPVRVLMAEAHEAITQLTPVLLMSPLSVSQYLSTDMPPFDLVIFDEASQITVWDAIGAIARGKQSIVAGDPKQLPPTNFFGGSSQSDDDSIAEEEMESILDEMLAANIPALKLQWHYRSQQESLITFSNHRYYNGELVTFPGTRTEDRAVHSQFVGGIYDRGGSQTNREEAEAIVAEIESRLTGESAHDDSIGVVTFNKNQQDLILNLLDEARKRNPGLDEHFGEDGEESVFVKNLESVQGDERDVILFSTTFGRDAAGKLYMNFGPVGQTGGERRLNVAITRARKELKVFTSLQPEQIDLSRSSAIGTRDLKHFLEFCQRGPQALASAIESVGGFYDSPFEEGVATALRERGWTVHSQIGVSRFRIDLGIVVPDAPGTYLAGIECDGATYHRSATARDRDKVREAVLRNLGWEIMRIWSTDYWRNPTGNVDKIDQALKILLAKQREARTRQESLSQ